MTRNEFEAQLKVVRSLALHTESARAEAGYLVIDLLVCPAKWTGPALLGVLYGKYGSHVAKMACLTLDIGLRRRSMQTALATKNHKESFTYWCAQLGRLDLVRSIVELGRPEFLADTKRSAPSTTLGGALLDRMSVQPRDAGIGTPKRRRQSFIDTMAAHQDEPKAALSSEALHECAALQVSADPAHAHMSSFPGTEIAAVLAEALMLKRIQDASAPNAGIVPGPSTTRQRRAGI